MARIVNHRDSGSGSREASAHGQPVILFDPLKLSSSHLLRGPTVQQARLASSNTCTAVRSSPKLEGCVHCPRPLAGEDRGPLRNAMGRVRALCQPSSLIYPILLRFAAQDGPLSSPAGGGRRQRQRNTCGDDGIGKMTWEKSHAG